jgi:hypothetical protein
MKEEFYELRRKELRLPSGHINDGSPSRRSLEFL